MNRILIFRIYLGAGYLLVYSLIAFSDGYTTVLVTQAYPGGYLELNPRVDPTNLIGILKQHAPRAALFTAMIVLSFVISTLPESVAKILSHDRTRFLDRTVVQVPGVAAITVLFLMLIATPNNLMVYSFQYGIFDFIFQLLSITDSNMMIAITPFLVMFLFALFFWPAYKVYNGIESYSQIWCMTNSSSGVPVV